MSSPAASALGAVCDLTERVARLVIGASVLGIVVITIASVWFRYVMDAPFSWTEQVCGIILVWVTFLGAALLYRRMLHIAIDMMVVMMPRAIQVFVYWWNQALVLVLAVLMIWFGGKFALANTAQTFGALEITPSWFYAAGPVTGALILLYWLEKLVDPRTRVPDGDVHL